MAITGNKGEWSEIYVLLKLLGDGVLYAGDACLERISGLYYPIVSIIRQESHRYVYSPNQTGHLVVITEDGRHYARIPMSRFVNKSAELLAGIKSARQSGGVFTLPETEAFMREIGSTRLKAPSKDKTDINVIIHDTELNMCPLLGFSIKSQLGKPSTLINATGATNVLYEVMPASMPQENVDKINAIPGHIERMKALMDAGCQLLYTDIPNRTFYNNLLLIDTCLPQLVANLLLENSINGVVTVKEATERVAEKNPLAYTGDNALEFYVYKVKELLLAAALGMMPARQWDGRYEANGGYIVVKENGDVVCYHFYKRNDVEDNLYNNTRFDRPSRKRYGWGTIIRGEDGKLFMRLNLQIRFIK